MSNQQRIKVTVLGAAGGIGQPLSLLLKLNPYITHLSLYDVVNVEGVAADLSHIDTDVIISYHSKSKDDLNNDSLKNALLDSNFVIIPAGIPRKPGMTRDDLFKINASICSELAISIALNCPNAFTLVISNPVNSTVAIFEEIFKKYNVLNPNKLCGITALDHVRANTFLSQLTVDKLPNHFNVNVVGGHSGETIVPLFSQVDGIPDEILNNNDVLDSLIHRVQYGGDEVVEAKKGTGSSTLSMAYAANKFFNAVLMGYLGLKNIQMSCLICLDDSIDGVKEFKETLSLSNRNIKIPEFFSIPVNFGEKGIKSVDCNWVNKMTDREKEMVNVACQGLNDSVIKGQSFVRGN